MTGTIGLAAAFTAIIGWMDNILGIFMEEPTVYFVAIALFGALATQGKKFIPMRRK